MHQDLRYFICTIIPQHHKTGVKLDIFHKIIFHHATMYWAIT